MNREYRNYIVQAHVDDPQWSHAGRVHDWRNHVGEEVRAIWDTFTPSQRMVLAADAANRASNEHWD